MRLQKFLSNAGIASRRKSEIYIQEGRVKVNNKIITELGYKVDLDKDKIKFDNKQVNLIKNFTYIMLNKPLGIVSSSKDEKGRNTVIDILNIENKRLYPIGRLDIDTTGLILITDDGEFANNYMHPKNKVNKKYIVTVEGTPNKHSLEKLRNGIFLNGRKTSPAVVKILKSFDNDSIIEITIHEGRNHQIKNMFSYIGHPVKKLKRVEIGPLNIGSLNVGEWRYLSSSEINELKLNENK